MISLLAGDCAVLEEDCGVRGRFEDSNNRVELQTHSYDASQESTGTHGKSAEPSARLKKKCTRRK